jgi:hypothetical protein
MNGSRRKQKWEEKQKLENEGEELEIITNGKKKHEKGEETKNKNNERFSVRYARKYTERRKEDTQPEVIFRSFIKLLSFNWVIRNEQTIDCGLQSRRHA